MMSTDFIHPEDAKAMKRLESIPGLRYLTKKFMELGYETMFHGINMASAIRLSPTQLPHIYKHLPPICEKLGIEVPEFYLEMNPEPNAYTYGDTRLYISVTSGLVEMLDDDELDSVLAHECGHIICRHTLYKCIATTLFERGMDMGLIQDMAEPLRIALYYWMRKSELSCDRVAALVTSPEVVMRVQARLAGGPKTLTAGVNFKEWAEQADLYDQIYNDGFLNNTLMICNTMYQSHPFAAVRVREILGWGKTDQYTKIKSTLHDLDGPRCPNCGHVMESSWKFCEYCGTKHKNY